MFVQKTTHLLLMLLQFCNFQVGWRVGGSGWLDPGPRASMTTSAPEPDFTSDDLTGGFPGRTISIARCWAQHLKYMIATIFECEAALISQFKFLDDLLLIFGA